MIQKLVLAVLICVAVGLAFAPIPKSILGIQLGALFGDCDPKGERIVMSTRAERTTDGYRYFYEFGEQNYTNPPRLQITFTAEEWKMIGQDSQFKKLGFVNWYSQSSGNVTIIFEIPLSSKPVVISGSHFRRPLETIKGVRVVDQQYQPRSGGIMGFWSPDTPPPRWQKSKPAPVVGQQLAAVR
ncbi:MAG: hypothetical protein A2751_02200 [Candidatus Doudnabacteria bacterium RIFCSPHIGHO2_01_FULL_46_14]|uniref:Uncharacterized protein n=1 Tax=Candidatus Doudnabacteria bacterium RIFCSPHIGHO2_01_FULL_46_14 TaxID=1817824 RepID=A0A1F5NJG7_9BACT|nr:MAG: hypothetical protein A2751_02200 [Candidatus Doudnabacteria bacterium RIFCSPHIGHO2_01_FULL_46_14]